MSIVHLIVGCDEANTAGGINNSRNKEAWQRSSNALFALRENHQKGSN
jgi:hypothetical protein